MSALEENKIDADSALVTVSHRYGWSFEEKAIISAFCVAAAVFIYTGIAGILPWSAAGIFAGFMVVGAVLLTRLGRGRKNTSKLLGSLRGSLLTVDGNGLAQPNTVDLKKVNKVDSRQVGINPTFILSDGEGMLHLPLRLARKEPITSHLENVLASANVSDDTRELAKLLRPGK